MAENEQEMTVGEALAVATGLQQRGEISRAYALCLQILAAAPEHAGALHLLGVLEIQRGRPQEAAALIGRAIALEPGDASFHCNLGTALRALGRVDEACLSYETASALEPELGLAQRNLGATLDELGRHRRACACYRRAIAVDPADARAHNNLGLSLRSLGRLDEAVAAFEAAIELRAGAYPKALVNLGVALVDLAGKARRGRGRLPSGARDRPWPFGRVEQPRQRPACARALRGGRALPPPGHRARGVGRVPQQPRESVLDDLERADEALDAHARAIELDPQSAEAVCGSPSCSPAATRSRPRPGFLSA